MFTVSAVVLTAVQSLRSVFQSIGAEKQSSAFAQSVDSGQLSSPGSGMPGAAEPYWLPTLTEDKGCSSTCKTVSTYSCVWFFMCKHFYIVRPIWYKWFFVEFWALSYVSAIFFFLAMFFFSHKLQDTLVVLCSVEHSSFIREAQLIPTQPTPKVLWAALSLSVDLSQSVPALIFEALLFSAILFNSSLCPPWCWKFCNGCDRTLTLSTF